ncbi:flavin reductase [Mesorhizobium sp. SP-1A]|uniref:flavin reductase n=1 Tax=Mesorhizobium sp. SP-1A TaxID=3077840 RepID=UPI0028F6D74F|nr:flavin reductase [Mesorhizobium sp. SP-1A]
MDTQNEFDQRAFRHCLGQFGTGVTVITTQTSGRRFGVTANSFAAVSLDPPLVLWSIKRTSRSFEAFQTADHFAINILGSNQIDISQSFSSQEDDKFAGVDWSPGKTGMPLIAGSIGTLECKIETRHEGGDHIIIVGRVLHFERNPGDALLFSQGRYAVAMEHPKLKTPADLAAQAKGGKNEDVTSFWRLMFLAQHRMSRRFDKPREQEGFNASETRVLMSVFDNPGCTIESLVERSFLTRLVAEDAIAGLEERGYIARESDGTFQLTPAGIARREVMAARWQSFEEEELKGISSEDIARARSVLASILSR